MPDRSYRGRFAPSPTGPLHFGSLLTALGSWLLARHAGGQWLIRIEDIDPPRTVDGSVESQLHTLAACGLHSDLPVVRQSERHALYQAALSDLLAQGKAFECGCSRAQLATIGGIHHCCLPRQGQPQRAVRLHVAEPSVVRFDDGLQGRQSQDVYHEVGDVVLRRADGYWAYQLAVVVDDADQGITDVVRGVDLMDSTPRQQLLQHALGLASPRYLHLPLVVGADGRKLSKSDRARPVDASDPLPALRAAWQTLGQVPEQWPSMGNAEKMLQQLVQHFRPERIPRQLGAVRRDGPAD